MAVSNFPIPATTHGGEPVGPTYLKLQELKPEYPSIVFKEMVDGGGTYGADSTSKVRRFQLTYNGLTAAQAKVLDDHYAEAKSTLLGFNYRNYRVSASIDELLSDTHYESFESDHDQYNKSQSRTIILVKRPA